MHEKIPNQESKPPQAKMWRIFLPIVIPIFFVLIVMAGAGLLLLQHFSV